MLLECYNQVTFDNCTLCENGASGNGAIAAMLNATGPLGDDVGWNRKPETVRARQNVFS